MTMYARISALLLAMLAACATTGELPPDGPDAGTSEVPQVDASLPTEDGGLAVYDGGRRDADARPPQICSDDDFCHSAVPTGAHLRALWGDGTGVVWAVTAEQDILRWDGASWNLHHHANDPISAIWGSGPADLWIASGTGMLHGTGDSSAQVAFAPAGFIPGDQAGSIRGIWGTGPYDAWAVGGVDDPGTHNPMRGRVLHYTDDPDLGLGWHIDSALSAQPIAFRGICGTPETGLWLYGVGRLGDLSTGPRVLHRPPGASTWESITLPDPGGTALDRVEEINTAWTTSDGSVWLVGTATSRSFVFQGTSTDGGATFEWTIHSVDGVRAVHAVWGLAGNDVWAVGEMGLAKHWDGATWSQAAVRVNNVLVTRQIWAIWGTSSDDFWIVGDELALHRTHGGKP